MADEFNEIRIETEKSPRQFGFKRPRGRPSKRLVEQSELGSTDFGVPTVEIGTTNFEGAGAESEETIAGPQKRRGRPPGSRNKTSGVPLDLGGIEAILLSVHSALAVLLKNPKLNLTEDEAKQLAKASANVARHYNVPVTAKVMDWTTLIVVCASIYPSRFKKDKPKDKPPEGKPTQEQSKAQVQNDEQFYSFNPNPIMPIGSPS